MYQFFYGKPYPISRMFSFTRKTNVKPLSEEPSRMSIRTKSFINRKKVAKKEGKTASLVGQLTHTAGLAVPVVAAAATVGLSVTIPLFVPAVLSVGFLISVLLRQKSMNNELKSHLGYIKMQTDRMLLSIRVIQDIAKERGIPLNTTNLSLSIQGITKKLMTLADKDTLLLLEKLEKERDSAKILRVYGAADKTGKQLLREASAQMIQTGGGILPARVSKFMSTWVSPNETLRQISNDLTIALGWYSIMMTEFDIFMKFMDAKQVPSASQWKDGRAMTDMLSQYKADLSGKTNAAEYSSFFHKDDIVEAIHIAALASHDVVEISSDPSSPGPNNERENERW